MAGLILYVIYPLFFLSPVPSALFLLPALLLGGGKQYGVHTQTDGEQPTFSHVRPGTRSSRHPQSRTQTPLLPSSTPQWNSL